MATVTLLRPRIGTLIQALVATVSSHLIQAKHRISHIVASHATSLQQPHELPAGDIFLLTQRGPSDSFSADMKRNRSHALGFVLEHRKKILKGLGALLQLLEKLPAETSVADLVKARKSVEKSAGKTAASKKRLKAKSKNKARPVKKKQEQPPVAETATTSTPSEQAPEVGAA